MTEENKIEESEVEANENIKNSDGNNSVPKNVKVKKDKKNKKSRSGVGIVGVLSLLAIAMSGYTLYELKQAPLNTMLQNDQSLQRTAHKHQSEIQSLQKSVERANQKILNFNNTSAQVTASFNSALGTYQGKLNALMQRVGRIESTYLMPQTLLNQQIEAVNKSAAILYVNLADQYISLAGDYSGAETLLKQAEHAILPLGARAATAKIKLNEALNAIQNDEALNSNSLATQLQKLRSESERLKMKKPGENVEKSTQHAPIETTISGALTASWDRFKSLVTVENLNETNKALLSHRTRAEIEYTLHVYLLQAQRAAFQNQATLFSDNLKSAQKLVETYFMESSQRDSWISALGKLAITKQKTSQNALKEALQAVENIQIDASAYAAPKKHDIKGGK
ncbi:uroporphyrinogen-III C-methyltransferase [Francisellaceae bacterium]|nr:uroporphyrinogen-III C-methyltransferase [Francisellaceae bacterium]